MPENIREIIELGLETIRDDQKKNGSFSDFIWEEDRNSKKIERRTLFPTALILDALNGLEDSKMLLDIKKKAADFLLSQKSENWSYNYWIKGSKESEELPYPDDLDDTSCTLSALYHYDKNLIGGKELAKIVGILTLLEENEGGPYRTWLVAKEADKTWKDIDLAVNSNVAYFLKTQGVALPNLEKFVAQKIKKKDISSPYYTSMYSVAYFISRFYSGKLKSGLSECLISKRKKDNWGNPLDTAFAISALLNLGYPPEKLEQSIGYLLKKFKDKEWTEYPFVELYIKQKKYFGGSSAQTTAFCIEALNKYLTASNKEPSETIKKDKKKDILKKAILTKAENRFSNLEYGSKEVALQILRKIVAKDSSEQVTLLPYFFANSIGNIHKKMDHEFLITLGCASLYGWIAYTIYDDFFDEEGDKKLLSVANLCLRQLTVEFNQLFPLNSDFHVLFSETMDTIDEANFWETAHCRARADEDAISLPKKLPDYKKSNVKLSDRSLGHTLGPLAILIKLGYDKNNHEIKDTVSCLENYIIARQLSDDMHDWEEDLKKGIITKVVSEILKIWGKDKKDAKKINIKKDIEELQRIFWYDLAQDFAKEILAHIDLSKRYLNKLDILGDKSFFDKLTSKIEEAAKTTIREQENTLEFMKNFNSID